MRKAQQDLDWKAGAVVFVQVCCFCSSQCPASEIKGTCIFQSRERARWKEKERKKKEREFKRERECVSACAWISGRVVEEKGIDKSKSTHVNTIFIILYIHRKLRSSRTLSNNLTNRNEHICAIRG